MAKVTSKYQVTVPKAVAEQYGIRPGDDIDWQPAGDAIRVIPRRLQSQKTNRDARIRLFDRATERIKQRTSTSPRGQQTERGWTREDLYERGSSR